MSSPRNVLLVFPPRPDPGQSAIGWPPAMVPQGLAHLAGALKAAGHTVRVADLYARPEISLESEISAFSPNVAGVYVSNPAWSQAVEVLRRVRAAAPRATLAAGGPAAYSRTEPLRKLADVVVCGEGERAIVEIADGEITSGIVTTWGTRSDTWPEPDYAPFLEAGPAPYVRAYPEVGLARPTLNINTSRGCPHACAFCAGPGMCGRKWRGIAADRILRRMDDLHGQYGIRSFYLREDNAAADPRRLVYLAERLENRDYHWACELRSDDRNAELLPALAGSGLRGIYVGVESGSQRVLDQMHKDIHVQDVERLFSVARRLGVTRAASVIRGWPEATEADEHETDLLLARIAPETTWECVFLGIPGSAMYDWCVQNAEHVDAGGYAYPRGFAGQALRYQKKVVPWAAKESAHEHAR